MTHPHDDLRQLLMDQDFQAADRLTLAKLCQLTGPLAAKRGWLYFTEVDRIKTTDLQIMDELWQAYSGGKFGFSIQRVLWLRVGKDWEKLWPLIGWRQGNDFTRYPQGFTWDTTAPKGHLPSSNQLRGVRVLAALLTHPAWSEGKG
ncbi:GUN4 domain-containing protein [Candidatus Cyanaurora vandensis]|uniref:GUN4 domain-containing protein n=1 Tax=Candidatus Cyanaurora vandensis TaxID=2714958 RepID=UPI00257C17C0|nr:GUN4 domain-containing protein [Candidatus Cyanaurora vandensis]